MGHRLCWRFAALCWGLFLALASGVQAAEEAALITAAPAELNVANRTIIVFQATVLGDTPETRARRALAVITEVLKDGGKAEVSIDPIQDSYLVLLADRRAFIITPKDLTTGSVREAAEDAARRLQRVVTEVAQAHNPRFLALAAGLSALATLLFVLGLHGLSWGRRKVLQWLPERVQQRTRGLRIGSTQLLETSNLHLLVRRLVDLLFWALVLLVSYEWLTFVLRRFPYTRPWGESLNQYLYEVLRDLVGAIVSAVPGLVIALLIFFFAQAVTAFSRRLLQRLARPGTLHWLSDETLQPTTRLTSLAIWLFALAMAYPYLPGAGTEAFKGLSVLIGLMISLGASSVVGLAAAGLILTYTRTLRPGEYIRVGEHEGTVTRLGMFTTSIRTGLGEVLTIPNSMLIGSVTKNYSRVVEGPGYVVDTVVTIGYDTPWRQVEAMLLEAARRTAGVQQQPPPRVLQTALSDFYPEYRLVAHAIPREPLARADLLNQLHANIQDVFNEYGVQIMSPHYLADPEQEKRVPRERWYAAPAQEPGPEKGEGAKDD